MVFRGLPRACWEFSFFPLPLETGPDAVDVVNLVGLGPGEVKNNYGLHGVGVRDVSHLHRGVKLLYSALSDVPSRTGIPVLFCPRYAPAQPIVPSPAPSRTQRSRIQILLEPPCPITASLHH